MASLRVNYRKHIATDPDVLAGKPVVKGIPVETVLARLAENPEIDDLLTAFPRLTLDDIRACLDFAAEHIRTA